RTRVVSPQGLPVTEPPSPTEMKVVGVISFILAIVFLHMFGVNVIRQLAFWVSLTFFIIAILVIRGIGGATGALLVLFLIIVIIVFVGLWVYIAGLLSPHIQRWEVMCLR
ncbi:MAG: hypothetical protein QMD14_05820, partial [Candidatus Aenigmarchaeota archaeon]|nr:hypothetical protein [Candidatus Aenigmarchaeota archaeon]